MPRITSLDMGGLLTARPINKAAVREAITAFCLLETEQARALLEDARQRVQPDPDPERREYQESTLLLLDALLGLRPEQRGIVAVGGAGVGTA